MAIDATVAYVECNEAVMDNDLIAAWEAAVHEDTSGRGTVGALIKHGSNLAAALRERHATATPYFMDEDGCCRTCGRYCGSERGAPGEPAPAPTPDSEPLPTPKTTAALDDDAICAKCGARYHRTWAEATCVCGGAIRGASGEPAPLHPEDAREDARTEAAWKAGPSFTEPQFAPGERAPATCPTHGDPLVCLACEAEEAARPEWRKPGDPNPATPKAEP